MKNKTRTAVVVLFIMSLIEATGDPFGSLRVVSGTANTTYQRYAYGRYWPMVSMVQLQSETTLYNVTVYCPVPGMPNYSTEYRASYRRQDPQPLGYYYNQSRIEIYSNQDGTNIWRSTNDLFEIPDQYYIPGIRAAWGTYNIVGTSARYVSSSSATLMLTNFTERTIVFHLTTYTQGKTNRYHIVSPAVPSTSAIRWRPGLQGGSSSMILLEWYTQILPEDPSN